MTETFWTRTQVGAHRGPFSALEGIDEHEGQVLVGDHRVPDCARVPAQLGGGEVLITGHGFMTCPGCVEPNLSHEVLFFTTNSRFIICECPRMGFLWCERRSADATRD